MRKLRVDFNDVRDGVVKGLLERASGAYDAPRTGDPIRLYDGEHEMSGMVRAIEDGLVIVDVDWNTWSTPSTRSSDVTKVTLAATIYKKTFPAVPAESRSISPNPRPREVELIKS